MWALTCMHFVRLTIDPSRYRDEGVSSSAYDADSSAPELLSHMEGDDSHESEAREILRRGRSIVDALHRFPAAQQARKSQVAVNNRTHVMADPPGRGKGERRVKHYEPKSKT